MVKKYGKIYQEKENVSIDISNLYNVWPIGSIYISVVNTNPSQWFGGVWEAFGEGQVLVGVDTSQTEFNEVLKTGGEKKHTLTIDELASHNHNIRRSDGGSANELAWGSNQWDTGMISTSGINKKNLTQNITNTGGNQPHNNLQPYITVYMWRRLS